MTKLAVQYFTLLTCENNEDTVTRAAVAFQDFNTVALTKNLEVIDGWGLIEDYSAVNLVMDSTDTFIEEFAQYIFKRASETRA